MRNIIAVSGIIRNYVLILCAVYLPIIGNEFSPVITVFNDQKKSCQECAQCLVDLIVLRQNEGKPVVLGLATGSSPVPFYQAFKKLSNQKNLDLSNIITFNLDEYCGIQ